jgi:hypothetical protein
MAELVNNYKQRDWGYYEMESYNDMYRYSLKSLQC